MRRLIAAILSAAALGSRVLAATPCPTDPSLSLGLDANGWSQFQVGPGNGGVPCEGGGCAVSATQTQLIYVCPASPNNINCTAGVNGSTCGAYASPCADPDYVVSNRVVRNNSPDWMLLAKGNTWANMGLGFLLNNGYTAQYPQLYTSWDPTAGHTINVAPTPDPATGGARPILQVTGSAPHVNGMIASNGLAYNYLAIVGIDFYAINRDPANGSPPSEATSSIPGMAVSFLASSHTLLEDNRWRYFTNNAWGVGGGGYSPNQQDHMYVRRNQFIGTYPPSNVESQGFITGPVIGTYDTNVVCGNVFDNNGWMVSSGITWAGPNGMSHNLYLNETVGADNVTGEDNGNSYLSGQPFTVNANLFANGASIVPIRSGASWVGNLHVLNQSNIDSVYGPNQFNSTISQNVIMDGDAVAGGSSSGFAIYDRYINVFVATGGDNVTQNIMANGAKTGTTGMVIAPASSHGFINNTNSGVNGVSVTNNYIYNWGTTYPYNLPLAGGVCPLASANGLFSVSAGGSGYTDISYPITSVASSGGSPNYDSQNYMVVQITGTTTGTLPLAGLYYIVGSGPGSVTGAFQGAAKGNNTVELFNTNFTQTFTGTLYVPYVRTTLGNSLAHGTGVTMDVVSAGGAIVAAYGYGDDYPFPVVSSDSYANDPGSAYQAGDILTVPALGGTGSGGQVTLTANNICSNNAQAGNNFIDVNGTNSYNWPDPNRTIGAFVAAHAAEFVVSSNASITGTVNSGVLNISSISGSVNVGDALTWLGQQKQEWIKFNSVNGSGSSCGGVSCTGSGTTGTYAIAGTETVNGGSSTNFKSWTTEQFVKLMDGQNKATWTTYPNLNVDAAVAYIQAGFGCCSNSWGIFQQHR
jgi:hypothetical protein